MADLGTLIAAGAGACAIVAGGIAFLRAWHNRERAFEEHVRLRSEFDEHVKESDALIKRFIILEKEAEVFGERLDELRIEVRAARDEATTERRAILGAISDLRTQMDAKLYELRRAVYEGDRRVIPRKDHS